MTVDIKIKVFEIKSALHVKDCMRTFLRRTITYCLGIPKMYALWLKRYGFQGCVTKHIDAQ